MEITNEVLQSFIAFSPTDIAIYRVKNGILETLFLSENIPDLLGMTREEYLKITARDAMDLTLPQDREALTKATMECIVNGTGLDHYYRVYSNRDGFSWVHVEARVRGEMEGDPIILAKFYNVLHEGGMFETVLNNSDRLTMVVDRDTHEILYANERIRDKERYGKNGLLGLKCHYLLLGRDEPCEQCIELQYDDDEIHEKYVFDEENNKWSLVTWRKVIWCRRDALIVYIKNVTAEKNNEQSLDNMNQMYQRAVEDAKEMLWVYDPKKNTVTYQVENPYTRMVCESIGMPTVIGDVPESIIGMVDEEFREGFAEMFDMDKIDEKGTSFEYSSTINGVTNWWRVTGRPIFGMNNEIKSVFCSGINITEEKQAESNYRKLVEQFTDIENIGISNFRLNLTQNKLISGYSIYPQLYLRLMTETAEEHFALAIEQMEDEAIKQKLAKQFTCRNLIELYNQGSRQIFADYPVKSTLSETEGQMRWIRAVNHLIMNPDTGDIEDISIVTDITRQKLTEKMLNVMTNQGCDYIGMVDLLSGTVEIIGGLWDHERLDGKERIDYSKVLGFLINEYVDPLERQSLAEQAELSRIEEKLNADGEVFIHYDFIDGHKGKLKKQIKCKWLDAKTREALIIQDDITEASILEQKRMKELQEALDQAKAANNAKSEFVSRISHDIRTPISAIISMTEFAKSDIDDKEKVYDDINKIAASSDFLLSLINDILDISKIDSGNIKLYPEAYPFDEYIGKLRDVFEPLCEQKGITLKVIANRDADAVAIVDKVRFDQVTMNLLSNAVKYTPKGGSVTYESDSKVTDDGKVQIQFTVSDTGIGMSKEFQQTMFEAFSQEDNSYSHFESGTGLGLTIVKKIVDIMDGKIGVKSELGVGTAITVSVLMPKASQEQIAMINGETADAGTEDQPKLSGKVLLAEDNAINTEIAMRMLRQLGLEAVSVENGAEALNEFSRSEEGEYSTILMDIQMPVMNGYVATERIRSLDRADAKTVPIIALTADAFAESVTRSMEAGMNDHITKPIDVSELRKTIMRYTGKR